MRVTFTCSRCRFSLWWKDGTRESHNASVSKFFSLNTKKKKKSLSKLAILHMITHETYSGSLSMWELHPLVVVANFHYDEKRVWENLKMFHPLSFSIIFFSLNTKKKEKKKKPLKVGDST